MKKNIKDVKKKKRKLTPEQLRLIKEKQRLLYLKQRRKQQQRKLMFRRVRGLLKLAGAVFMFLIVVYLLLLPQWKLNPLIFTHYPNKNLVIDNNFLTKDFQVLEKLKPFDVYKKPIYLLNTRPLEQALLELDTVKNVRIRRYLFPARLKVVLDEKKPLFMVYENVDSLPIYAINNDATQINRDFLPLPESTQKATYKIILPGHQTNWKQETIDQFEKIILIAEKTTGEKLEYLDLSKPKDVYIKLSTNLIRLGEIDATVMDRVSRLGLIMPSVKKIENIVEYIDLRWDHAINLKEKSDDQIESKKSTGD